MNSGESGAWASSHRSLSQYQKGKSRQYYQPLSTPAIPVTHQAREGVLMAKICLCGSPMCPICRGRPPGVAQSETPNIRRNKGRRERPIYEFGKVETPNVPPHEAETQGVRSETVNVRPDKAGVCLECGRPYCPECGEPIPVRGEYCKSGCRVKAWRKKKAE